VSALLICLLVASLTTVSHRRIFAAVSSPVERKRG
jgi:hypothetical protein